MRTFEVMSSTGIKVEFSAFLARPVSPFHWPELLWVDGSHGQHARGCSETPAFPATFGTLSLPGTRADDFWYASDGTQRSSVLLCLPG